MTLIVEAEALGAIDLGAEAALTDRRQQAVVLHEVGDRLEADLEVADTPLNRIVQVVRKLKEI